MSDDRIDLPPEWDCKPLASLVSPSRGISYGVVQPGYDDADGVPIVRVNNIRGGRIRIDEILTVAKDIEAKHTRTRLLGGEVLLTLVGTLGECAVVPGSLKGWNVARAVGVIPVETIDPRWIAICLRSAPLQHLIKTWATTTVQATLNLRDVARLPIPIPPRLILNRITDILSALDDKIDLNRRMNDTLEAIIRAHFRAWFVDFEPVRAKSEGRHPSGVSKELSGLFPDSFESCELGDVPRGWTVANLGSFLTTQIGGDWGQDTAFDGATEVVALRGVDLEHLRSEGAANAPRRWVKKSSLAKRRMSNRDILIASSGAGPCGRPLWVSTHLESLFPCPVLYSNFCKRFQAETAAHAIYFDRLLFEMRQSGEIWEYVNGTSLPNLDANGLLASKLVIVPSLELLEKFAEFTAPIYERLYSGESRTLAQLRDALLPKLMSGEVSV